MVSVLGEHPYVICSDLNLPMALLIGKQHSELMLLAVQISAIKEIKGQQMTIVPSSGRKKSSLIPEM
jgi:hypothetical protein